MLRFFRNQAFPPVDRDSGSPRFHGPQPSSSVP